MTVTHLGATFDIHAGGKDLIFPHHENEIAQSQGADGEGTFARYWLHNGFLNFEGVKMSKSLGNVFNCDQIAEAVGGEALRYFCVKHHYRSPVDFEVEEVRSASGTPVGVRFRSLEAADRRLEKFYVTLQKIDRKRAIDLLKEKVPELVGKAGERIAYDDEISKVSVVGVGMRSHAGIAKKMFQLLAAENINIQLISTSEIKISCVIARKYAELAVRTLHEGFGLSLPPSERTGL